VSQRAVVAYSFQDMRVRVLFFGVLKEVFGAASADGELAEGARVADLLEIFVDRSGGREELMRSIAVAVNQEYAKLEQVLRDGDEVALLPPVSGGVEGVR
jgi:sulfur-carrier protein